MMSNYARNKTLNMWLRRENFDAPHKVFLALLTAIPSVDDDSVSEVSGGDYARVELKFSEAENGWCINEESVVFEAPTDDWTDDETPIIAVAVMDSESGGGDGGSSSGGSSDSGGSHWLWAAVLCDPLFVRDGDPAPEIDIGGVKAAIGQSGGC